MQYTCSKSGKEKSFQHNSFMKIYLDPEDDLHKSIRFVVEKESDYSGFVDVIRITKTGYERNYHYYAANGKYKKIMR